MKKLPSLAAVDVIIPTYNGMPYLREAIESVLAQTYENLKLYVIDDGSTDNGATEKYLQEVKDSRVSYHKKTNGGQATARNLGIKISKSPFITFLDADDVWRPDKLQRQMDVFHKKPDLGMVYGMHKLIDASGKEIGRVTYKKRGDLFNYLLRGNRVSGSGSMVMARRKVFNDIGSFREDFLIGEDWEMWLRIADKYEIDYVDDFIADLRVLDAGMQQNHLRMAAGLEYMFPVIEEEFKLDASQRKDLTVGCFLPSIPMYYNGGDRASAKRMFLTVLKSRPLALITFNHKLLSIYLRLIVAPNWLRRIRRSLSYSYRKREARSWTSALEKVQPPAISVVMPVYNAEKYLKESIESILGQTFTNFELIIIDDGSKDGSRKILDKFSESDNRVHLIKHPANKGLVESLNDGLAAARGKYIARMDADDISLPDRFKRQLLFMEEYLSIDVLGTQIQIIDSSGKRLQRTWFKPISTQDVKWLLGHGAVIAHPSVFIRRRNIPSEGYIKSTWPAEDYDMWQRIYTKHNIANLPEVLLQYRILDSGISQSNLSNQTDLTSKMSAAWRKSRMSSVAVTSPLTALAVVRRTKKARRLMPGYDISDYYFGLYDECLKDVAHSRLMQLVLRINIRFSARILRWSRL
jgi:glycosyltransferase involved in cell wall biosynthesis